MVFVFFCLNLNETNVSAGNPRVAKGGGIGAYIRHGAGVDDRRDIRQHKQIT